MKLDPTGSAVLPAGLSGGPAGASRAASPEEAAKQFEMVLAQQFVQVMTKGLFEHSLAGEGAPGGMAGQADLQRDLLAKTLAEHLVDSGTLGIADRLARQWREAADGPADTLADARADAAGRPAEPLAPRPPIDLPPTDLTPRTDD